MKENVYIIGSHMTKTGKLLDTSIQQLTNMTLEGALSDSGLKKEDVESIHFANCAWPYFSERYQCITGQIALRHCGVGSTPVTNHEAACSSGSLALHTAVKDVLSGMFECSLAIGVEKLVSTDKKKMSEFFDSCVHNETKEDFDAVFDQYDRLRAMCTDVEIPAYDETLRSPFMDLYATFGLTQMQRYDIRFEDYAMISAKNHTNSQYNPLAQYQFPLTPEEVMNDYMVSYPLTRSMCAPFSDGAASAIVCSEAYLKRLPKDVQDRAVLVRASTYLSGFDHEINELNEDTFLFATSIFASKKAYEMAGVGPQDIDVCECHDATAIGEMGQYENLGFCEKGEAGHFARNGKGEIGGEVAVNTSGGLQSRGHPIGASGLCMIYEIVTQLRGEADKRQVEDARMGMTENGGGMIGWDDASCSVHILEKV